MLIRFFACLCIMFALFVVVFNYCKGGATFFQLLLSVASSPSCVFLNVNVVLMKNKLN